MIKEDGGAAASMQTCHGSIGLGYPNVGGKSFSNICIRALHTAVDIRDFESVVSTRVEQIVWPFSFLRKDDCLPVGPAGDVGYLCLSPLCVPKTSNPTIVGVKSAQDGA